MVLRRGRFNRRSQDLGIAKIGLTRDKCAFATKQHMFGVLAIVENLITIVDCQSQIPHIKPPPSESLQVCRQMWHFVVNLSVRIVRFQMIWGPGKFTLKWMNWGRPPLFRHCLFFYRFYIWGLPLTRWEKLWNFIIASCDLKICDVLALTCIYLGTPSSTPEIN